MLPVILQVQNHSVPQEHISNPLVLAATKTPQLSLVAASLSYWEESESCGSKHFSPKRNSRFMVAEAKPEQSS